MVLPMNSNYPQYIREFIRKIQDIFEKNKLTFSAIILCTIVEAVWDVVPYQYYKDSFFEDNVNIILLTLLYFVIPALFMETYFAQKRTKCICGYMIAFVFSGAAAICTAPYANIQIAGLSGKLISDYAGRFVGGILLILLAAIIYRSYQNTEMRFEEYAVKVFYNIMKALIICFVLSFGTAFICAIMGELFLSYYYSYSIESAAVILVLGFYLAPKMVLALRNVYEEPGKVICTIVKYILPAFMFCAVGMVYLYIVRILLFTQMPSNEVFSIVSALFCLGLPVCIMAGYYKDETKYMKMVSFFPYLFAPLILLQIYSIGIRIYEYGLTPGRYMGIMLIIFETGALIIRRFWEEKYERLLPFFALLVVIAVFVPGINMNKVSNLWQMSFLKKYYQAVESGKTLSELEYERLTGANEYLVDRPDMQKAIEPYNIYDESFAAKLKEQYVGDRLTQYDRYRIHCCQMVGDLDVGGYSKMSMLNQNSCYDEVGEDGISVDFSSFQFVKRETGEALTADISEFAQKCMEYKKNFPDASVEECSAAMKEHNRIRLDDGSVLYVNHFEVKYYDGVRDAEPYFEWISINISGILLEK